MPELHITEENLLRLSTGKNKSSLLRELFKGMHHFGELHHGLQGVPLQELIRDLLEMEKDGLIRRVDPQPDITHARLNLTSRGISLKHLIDNLEAKAAKKTKTFQ